jgi:hypothetical protein
MSEFTENKASQEEEDPTYDKEGMKLHYEHYSKLAESGELTEEDQLQWQKAKERKEQGLID